ncbi:hypothetical protein [Aureimonas sp. SK2]|uniref:hypothetical protein n=1 Tax=Aureimonas sp. SK2 TaxID=3015992 RepID=UPI002443A644|nr:hypothetical protein [Aureimonas sp. SK2]
MPDPNSDAIYAALEREFGGPIHGWPLPDGSVMSRIRINPALAAVGLPSADDEFAGRFMDELQHGQIDEDFGGFLWRCWCAALEIPNEFLERYGRASAPQAA